MPRWCPPPLVLAESLAVVQAAIPHWKRSLKEVRLARCLVTKLARILLHVYALPELFCPFPSKLSLLQACHIISPLTKVPVSSSCQSCPYSSPFPAFISLLSHSQFPTHSLFAMHFQFFLIFPPFLCVASHPHPIQLPLLISFPFSFNSVQAATSLLPGLSRIQGHSGEKPSAQHCHGREGPLHPCTGACSVQMHRLGSSQRAQASLC